MGVGKRGESKDFKKDWQGKNVHYHQKVIRNDLNRFNQNLRLVKFYKISEK
jgi:hypothetical protein